MKCCPTTIYETGGGGGSADFSALSGDGTATEEGVLTLADPHRVHKVTVTLTDAEIVGNTAGTVGHASGAELVAAVANRRIQPVSVTLEMNFDTAAYTGGGNSSVKYATSGVAVTTASSGANTFGATLDRTTIFAPTTAIGAVPSIGIGEALMISATSAFTQPGTAAGTAAFTIYYLLLEA